ncbi:MAG: formylglycine-generating enzyme family protein [Planctomycetaceae bacterium]
MTRSIRASSKASIGRADLVWVLGAGGTDLVEYLAAKLELEQRLPAPERLELPEVPFDIREVARSDSEQVHSNYPVEIDDIALWLVTRYQQRKPLDRQSATAHRVVSSCWFEPPKAPPECFPLTPISVVLHRLQGSMSTLESGFRPDVPRLVDRVAQQEFIDPIPTEPMQSAGRRLAIVQDVSNRLMPFRRDQRLVIDALAQQRSPHSTLIYAGQKPSSLRKRKRRLSMSREVSNLPPNCDALVLGDLGVLSDSNVLKGKWLTWVRRMQARGCCVTALVPFAVSDVPVQLRQIVNVQPWPRDPVPIVRNKQQRAAMVRRLLIALSPAVRISYGLLRGMRALFPEAADATLEVDVSRSPLMATRSTRAFGFDHGSLASLRAEFEQWPETIRSRVLNRIRDWRLRSEQGRELWFEELICLPDSSRRLVSPQDLETARAEITKLVEDWKNGDPEVREHCGAFLFRQTERITDFAFQDEAVGHVLREVSRKVSGQETPLAPGTDAREIPAGEEETVSFAVNDRGITFYPENAVDVPQGRLTGEIRTSNRAIEIHLPQSEEMREKSFWKHGKPKWVSDYGRDQYGLWCEFQVPKRGDSGVVTQRLRWISPGTFAMGSPEDEPERQYNEAQHTVTLTKGYWLADTTCTQEMWMAVMGDNPSRFSGNDQRPVEQVSYSEAWQFLERAGELLSGLELKFPTETQWEYACRAGTTTPFSFGDQITTEQANYNGNYPYHNAPQGEYRKTTVVCKEFEPNRWGLYQMHGNVWEWCRDWYGDYPAEDQLDPVGPETGSARVVRGGSWSNDAGWLRSACRYFNAPGLRFHDLGFRCMGSPSLAEPNEGAEVPVAEQGSERARAGAASRFVYDRTVSIRVDEPTQVEFHSHTSVCLKSDLEEITLTHHAKPTWAVDYGQDQYGVFADLEVGTVRQRMRYIPPGKFVMGSPKGEAGRFPNEKLHAVTISNGYWMFDTPCTQALWMAVMDGENPSYFSDPLRPVEQVDWKQAKKFSQRLTELVPHLLFDLPTEAQWEYACRAGTTSALFSGPLEIIGDANAPALDPIAWYGGNSGHEYDLETKVDLLRFDWFFDKQYDFQFGGTRKVKHKQPNLWGLYDMLGNVWEWCRNWYAEYPDGEQVDPVGPETGSFRAIRGGSWSYSARGLRSASRGRSDPGSPHASLGFRCLSSPQSSPVQSSRRTSECFESGLARDEPAEKRRTQFDAPFVCRTPTMQFAYFQIPCDDPFQASEELNQFNAAPPPQPSQPSP